MTSITKSWLCATCRRKAPMPLASRISFYSTSTSTPTSNRYGKHPRMAVVGSGPAGFYTAYRIMSRLPGAKIDMYEALPVPYGLVRFGVAPDHPEVKNCETKFEEVASSPDFTFIGNVAVGNADDHFGGCTVPLDSMMRHYDGVVFAYGASKDKQLGIPGESELKGIYSAREFVGWYNGLPEFASLDPNLTRGDEAVIIGQGNVALDVARMLLEDVDVLRKTDITEVAIQALSESRIKRVHIVGRRGPMQAAFTIKEVRELMNLPGVGFRQVKRSLIPDQISALPRAPRRLMDILVKGSASPFDSAPKKWSLDFCLSPTEFLAGPGRYVDSTVFEKTSMVLPFYPSTGVSGTGERVEIPSSVVFRSIGYKSAALPGFEKAGISFNDRNGIIDNDGMGRVLQAKSDESNDQQKRSHVPGVYCAGWVKRGPTGVIASTMEDAFSTGDAIASDWNAGVPFLEGENNAGWEALREGVQVGQSKAIHWDDWQRINKAEKLRGSWIGKEREKFLSATEMTEAAKTI
ncbi:nucleotide-binding domain-containing protein [Annulohypoxylon maeteangense]|uniref:nucleotide-binding domain-containing protein n=1 Tax=Annulohypoxylon maeteangense TaxID=1927788 RepID=UPI00200814F5|nr:nucleotide-binding domain-containing protein [Annulohypoxylon maeteangense]KAI0888843.1 nucleotide-binding domain-containing protein [Annulohypoxylon maeteangense]